MTHTPLKRLKKKPELNWSRVMLIVSALGILGLLNVHLNGEVIETEYRTQLVRKEIAQMRQDISVMRMEVSKLENPDRLEKWGRSQAGMVKPSRRVYAYPNRPVTESVASRN